MDGKQQQQQLPRVRLISPGYQHLPASLHLGATAVTAGSNGELYCEVAGYQFAILVAAAAGRRLPLQLCMHMLLQLNLARPNIGGRLNGSKRLSPRVGRARGSQKHTGVLFLTTLVFKAVNCDT